MDIAIQKAELIEWIGSLTDEAIIKDIMAVKTKKEFDFEKEWAKSVSIENALERSKHFISALPWKK
jgi:hypothetical protein